jgi:poly(A) polymerase
LKRFLRLRCFEEHLELHRLDCVSSHGDLTNYEYAREQFLSMQPDEIRPKPLVTGHDLIAAGYKPGPRFKQILSAVEDGQLEGRFRDKEAALKFVEREFPEQAGR